MFCQIINGLHENWGELQKLDGKDQRVTRFMRRSSLSLLDVDDFPESDGNDVYIENSSGNVDFLVYLTSKSAVNKLWSLHFKAGLFP